MRPLICSSPAKPSRPSRAYFRVTSQPQIAALSDKVRQTPFQDAKNTLKDAVLLGPPSLEFAPYGKVSSNRVRKDGRQGTIDQDPEYMDFLQSLTDPIVKAVPPDDQDSSEKKDEKVTTTPLIQFLKEKKANKGKEKEKADQAKASKHARQESKDAKADKAPSQSKKVLNRQEKENPPSEKKGGRESRAEKAAKDAVKVLNKQAATATTKATEKAAGAVSQRETAASPMAEKKRERERGSASAAAKILQRDLGLAGGGRRRQKPSSPDLAKATPVATTSSSAPSAPASQPQQEPPKHPTASNPLEQSAPSAPSSNPTTTAPPIVAPPTGPAASRHQPRHLAHRPRSQHQPQVPALTQASQPAQTQSQPHAPSPQQSKASPPLSVSLSTGTQAFLKHANPSQGITEPLLEEAFSVFGKTTKVEIDKKKGFGYIDFAEPEGLQKAMQASPVKVAQGQVVVLERKTGPNLAARNVRGGGNTNTGVRGGHIPPLQQQPQPPPQPQVTPPTAPAAGRGGGQHGPVQGHRPPYGPRGGRGGRGHRGGVGRGGHTNAPSQQTPAANTTATQTPASSSAPPPLAPAPPVTGG